MKTTNASRLQFGQKQERNPLRLTALLYLKDALVRERYEECSEIIRYAYLFGAREPDIEALLEDPRRSPRA